MIKTWPSPAKLNLFLYITGERSDGYHDLQTLFQFLDYGDTLTIETSNSSEIKLTTPFKGLAAKDNLIVRAAEKLKAVSGYSQGATLSIQKNLPLGGGLGGGSSNAATTLLVLNALWDCQLTLDELAKIGLTLGADVPIFIHGYAAFAEGVGEILSTVTLPEPWFIVAYPNLSISTTTLFRDPDLQRNATKRSFQEHMTQPFSNVFEPLLRKQYQEVDRLFTWLQQYAPTHLSGTGPSLFSEFTTFDAAKQVLEQLPKQWNAFLAKGCNVSPLHQALTEYK